MSKNKTSQQSKTSLDAKPSASQKNSLTILIHGTFSRRAGRWHKPGSMFHRFLARNFFPDVYSGRDFFDWSGGASDRDREQAAIELIEWCKQHPATTYNLISHSHGTNVANLATNLGLTNVNKLVHLSPPVWDHKENYLPNMNNVSTGRIFNFHPKNDWIVTDLARAAQNYDGTNVDYYEREYVLPGFDHWAPVRRIYWKMHNIGEIVTNNYLCDDDGI